MVTKSNKSETSKTKINRSDLDPDPLPGIISNTIVSQIFPDDSPNAVYVLFLKWRLPISNSLDHKLQPTKDFN